MNAEDYTILFINESPLYQQWENLCQREKWTLLFVGGGNQVQGEKTLKII